MKKSIASLAIVALLAGNALAQGQSQSDNKLDKHIAACLLLGNQEQVALAKFAKERCESEQCKEFAQMMIEKHQQAISKIEEAAPELAAKNLELRNANPGEQENQGAQPQTGTQAGGLDPALMLARQVKEECLALTTKALGQKQGAEFDKCYIDQQVMAHMLMKAQLKGSEPFASEQLKPVIQEGLQMTEQHLTQTKDLVTQLQDKATPRQARAE